MCQFQLNKGNGISDLKQQKIIGRRYINYIGTFGKNIQYFHDCEQLMLRM